MDLREIKAFLVVAEELNFRKASEVLNMTQPPLTRLISQLESDLGVKLFTRSTRKVELTGAGLHLLKESRELLLSVTKIEREIRAIGKLKTGQLRVGLNAPALHSELPHLISSFKEQFKGISLNMSEMLASQQTAGLDIGKFDVCFGERKITHPDIENLEVLSQELGFLVSPGHRLARKKEIKLSDLKDEVLIFHGKNENLGFQTEFHNILKKKDIPVKIYYKGHKESCPSLAIMDKGILLSSKKNGAHVTGLKFVRLSDYSPKLRVYVMWNKNNQSLALKAFLNFFEENHFAPASDLDCHLKD